MKIKGGNIYHVITLVIAVLVAIGSLLIFQDILDGIIIVAIIIGVAVVIFPTWMLATIIYKLDNK